VKLYRRYIRDNEPVWYAERKNQEKERLCGYVKESAEQKRGNA
jgi:hypothetical protein